MFALIALPLYFGQVLSIAVCARPSIAGSFVRLSSGGVVLVRILQCGSVAVWQCSSVAVWWCGSVVVWQCGSVVVW